MQVSACCLNVWIILDECLHILQVGSNYNEFVMLKDADEVCPCSL